MSRLKSMFINKKDGGLNTLVYILLYFVLAHAFFYKFLVPGSFAYGTDTIGASYPMQVAGMREVFENRSIPLWNPYIFSGMPLLASFSFHILYPMNWIYFFLPTEFAMGYQYVLHTFLMGVFMFALLRHLKLSRPASFAGGLLYMFSAHFISLIYPGHGSKIFTVTYLPLALMFLDRAFESRPVFNFALLGLMVGLMFYGGHPQIMFYCGITTSLFFAVRLLQEYRKNRMAKSVRLAGLYVAALTIGALLYAAILLPAWEYRGYTQRAGGIAGASSYEFATSFSQPPEDLLYVPLRDPFGWGKYYGPNVPTTSGIFYKGRIGLRLSVDYFSVFGLVLAVFAVVFVRNRYTWFFLGLGLVVSFLALGGFNPLYIYIYKYVPGFSMFRVPYAIMVIMPLCCSVLAAFGLQRLIEPGDWGDKNLAWFIAGGSAIAAAVLLTCIYWQVNAAGVGNWLARKMLVQEMLWGDLSDFMERYYFFLHNVFIFAALLGVSMLLLFVYRMGWLKAKYLTPLACVFILADLWPLDWDFIKTVPVSSLQNVYYKETPEIKFIEGDRSGPFRVFSMVTNNELLNRGIESLTGYHAAILSYYEEVIDRIAFEGRMLDMLNAKYLILPKNPEYNFGSYPDEAMRKRLMDKYEPIGGSDVFFYRNRTVLPRAWLVNALFRADDQRQALDIVSDPRFAPERAAVLTEEPTEAIPPGADISRQKTELVSSKPDSLEFRVSAPAESFMVVSEVWYPGWKAYVDGHETKVYRTDSVLRGIVMPAGEHSVVMVFKPLLFRLGAAVSLASLAILAAVTLWPLYRNHRKGLPL